MRSKFGSVEFTIANLALDHYCWALPFNMLEKLCSRQVLVLLSVADVTSKFWALVKGMLLKIKHGFPYDSSTTFFSQPAFMGKLTEVNTVSENLVDILEKVSLNMAAWTAHGVSTIHLSIVLKLELAVLAKQLIALFALQRLVRKVTTHHTLDLIYHFPLEFVLNLGHLDI